ncbi:putative LLM family oxidoreductase [Diaminobutyricimonas aerilata]|uniref:Putative LLM family oxidoreductase n=1 Tax=Diaminobutyricimonas aerilata TaxID=1162967 RepID=A0A2M9CF42_9MICO|nr:LLM class flavin-dependent oxidoreductase [Diaminobutyricimonas aerilata]PJJ70487.1 putative LLM family oxidoreductase [Diaminobutyricimonas aerilata]
MSNPWSQDSALSTRAEPRVADPAPGGLHFGIGTFAFQTADDDGSPTPGPQVLRDVVAEAVAAERAGLDSFGIAEHYRPGMMDSAAPVVLGAIASRTTTLRLGTAVTVLSTQDPVRVYNEYATLDAVSDGRAQLIVGRGSAIESFPLFGFRLADYEQLFEEKLDLLMRLLREQPVTWSGRFRSPLVDQVLEPSVAPGAIPVWVGVGGSPQSVVRAARFGLPLMLGIIGGSIERFGPLVDLYRRTMQTLGQAEQPVGMHVHGFIADTDDEAIERFWPVWSGMMNAEAPKRGWAPFRRDRYDAEVAAGSLVVGSPETVARQVAAGMRTLGATRFDFVAAASRMPHKDKRENIERFGLEVVPHVRTLLADTATGVA